MGRQFHKARSSWKGQFHKRLRLDFHHGTVTKHVLNVNQRTVLFRGRKNLNALKYGNLNRDVSLRKTREGLKKTA